MGSKFWGFSLAVYSAEAVERECLVLQDQFGLDINLLLLCAFLGAVRGVTLTADDIVSACAEVASWHDDIVRPLRAARRRLKTVELPDARLTEAAAQLRTRVKAAELESEYVEQLMLERWADVRLAARPRGEPRDAAAANLQILLKSYGATEPLDAVTHLLAAALARPAKT
ncbi:MAG TPA: TIGR02444 family protein [Pseudolabrys sp.]|nr:TIGR02444 family protein [Pseudolabrys sp.]